MSANMARILMYHNFSSPSKSKTDAVDVNAARSQIEYLRRHFHVVPLTQLVEQLKSGVPMEKNSVVLTIDDGRRNCYEFFFPLLKEFGMPATFFVVSSFVRREDWVWTDKVLWLAEQSGAPDELHFERIDAFFEKLNRLRPEARNAQIDSLANTMNVSIPRQPPPKYEACSWSQLREMADSGLVEIGSHSVTHPILTTLTDRESWQELTLSRTQIEEGLGRKINSFCFPNGKASDYRPAQLRQVIDAGYTSAVVTRFGLAGNGSDPYELPRIGVGGTFDSLHFSKYLDGVEHYQEKLKRSFDRR